MGESVSCSWPVATKVLEKPFTLRAMRTALMDRHLDGRLLTRRLDCLPPERAVESSQEERQDEESVCDHSSVATQNVN